MRGMGRFGQTGAPVPASPAGAMQGNPWVNPLGALLDPQVDGSDWFFYQTVTTALAPSTTANSQIQIDAGTDFLWLAATYNADIAEGAQTGSGRVVPLVTLLISDTGASKNLMNAAVPIDSLAGTGQEPYRLVRPRLFRANSVINFTWTSYVASGTTYGNIYLIMHGIRKIAGTFNLSD